MVGASWMMMFLVNAVAVSIFFKPILEEFKTDRATLSAVYTGAHLLVAFAAPFLGWLVDRFGPRFMLFVCLATLSLSSTINGFASRLWQIFFGRFVYEIKALQASQVLINRWFVRKRGQAQGIAATGVPFGSLILAPLSQFLILAWGWRDTLFFWAGISFVILLPLTLLVRNSPEDKGVRPDGDTAEGGWTLQPGEESHQGPAGRLSGPSLAGAARQASFRLLAATQLICGIGCGFMMTHIVIFATDYGYSDMIGASLVSVQGGMNLVGLLLTGHISDRHARNRVLSLTHVVRSLAFLTAVAFILRSPGGSGLWMLYLAMALFGFGWFTTSPLSSGLVADLFGGRSMGTIIGVMTSCHTVGMALGAYFGGFTYDHTGSYYWFFVVQTVLEMVAAGFAFAIKKGAT
jgi:OFA family oxalate/formate antiporter-like MFS transporter